MLNERQPLFVIQRSGKRKNLSAQAEKDQMLTAQRLRDNEETISLIVNRLEYLCGPSPQKKDMLVVAKEMEKRTAIQVDRLAKRSRDCLICWFCENWTYIVHEFEALCCEQSRASFDSRNSCPRLNKASKVEQTPGTTQTDCYNDFALNEFMWDLPALEAPIVSFGFEDEFGYLA